MRWTEGVAMDERLRFVRDALSDHFSMSELCARYGVSRRIGAQALVLGERHGRSTHRPGRDRRRDLGHSLQHRLARDLR